MLPSGYFGIGDTIITCIWAAAICVSNIVLAIRYALSFLILHTLRRRIGERIYLKNIRFCWCGTDCILERLLDIAEAVKLITRIISSCFCVLYFLIASG